MRGRFITFEGGEGTGKSTQVQLLAQRLEQHALPVLITREPGGSAGAEAVRHVLLSGAAQPLGPLAEAILFAAARDDHIRSMIAPALSAGKWVLCDRFADSTRVYQGALGKVDREIISSLEHAVLGDLRPDLTLVLDLQAELALARAAARRGAETADRFEGESAEFHEALRRAYRELTVSEPGRCVLVDANRAPEAVAEAIWGVVAERFDLSTAAADQYAEAAS